MKSNSLALLFLCLSLHASAQDTPDWEFPLEPQTIWEFSDPEFQINYSYNRTELAAFDYREQKVLWSQNITGRDKVALHFIAGHTYGRLEGASFSDKKRKGDRTVILNRFTGEILFDAEWTEFENIQETYFLANAGFILLKGKENKENLIALVKLGEKQIWWKKEMPLSRDDFTGFDKLTFSNEFKLGPIANENTLIFAYAGILFGLDTGTGEVAWEKPVKETAITFLTLGENEANSEVFYVVEKPQDTYLLNAYHLRDFSPAWKEPYKLIGYHHLQFGAEEILVRTGNFFNYLNYKGEPKWQHSPEFKHRIDKLYQQNGEYLVWTIAVEKNSSQVYDTTYFLNWLNKDQKVQWEQPVAVSGDFLRMGKRVGDRLVFVTDEEIGVIDMTKGSRITVEMPCFNCLYALDTLKNQMLFYTGDQLVAIDYTNGSWKRVAENIKWEKDAQPQTLKVLPSAYALLTERQVLMYDHEGNLTFEQYYPEKATLKPLKVVGALTALTVGFLLPKEVGQINRALHQSELINSEEYMNNAMAMAAYRGVGAGLVASNFAGRFMQGSNNKEQQGILQELENLWLIRDKLDNGQFGLRVFDLAARKEKKTIWLADSEDFGFWIEPSLGGIMKTAGGKLVFYKL